MNTNVNLAAPVGALALLGTSFVLFVAAIFLIQSLIVRKRRRAKFVLVAMVAFCGLYLAAILIFSIGSHEKLLARGEEKHFCELDCHLAYSIVNTRRTKTLVDSAKPASAQGVFAVVTVQTRFDETTIAPWRGNGLLYPNSRALTLIDERGNRYQPVSQSGTPLTNPLRPSESYTTDIVFDVPSEMKRATLLMNESDWITRLVIGHENSPLHQKASFQIDLQAMPLTKSDSLDPTVAATLSPVNCEQHQAVGRSRLIRFAESIGSRLRYVVRRLASDRTSRRG